MKGWARTEQATDLPENHEERKPPCIHHIISKTLFIFISHRDLLHPHHHWLVSNISSWGEKNVKEFNEFSCITHSALILRIQEFKNTVLHKSYPKIMAMLPTWASVAGGSTLTRNSGSSHTHCEGLKGYDFYFLNLPIRIILLRTGVAVRHCSC